MSPDDSPALNLPGSSARAAPLWQPIAGGALADSLRAAVGRIADALAEPVPAWLPAGAPAAEQRAADLSLAGGAAGQAVLHGSLHASGWNGATRARAVRCLTCAAEGMAHVAMESSLYSGFTGIAWAVEHLTSLLFERDDADALADVDDALCAHLARGGPPHFDLVSGLVGVAIYALERRPSPRADEILHLAIALLEERAERTAEGIVWRTPPEASTAPGLGLGPYDLGLAHGTPGAIAVLAAAHLQGFEVERTRALMTDAIEWLHARRLPAGASSAYAASAGPGSGGEPSRLAWCYGDLGIACALHLAARAAGVQEWANEAIALAVSAGERDPEAGRVRDAPFCHGASGVAHLLNRLYQASGESRLVDAARAWLSRALACQESDTGFGGFRTWAPRESVTGTWVDDPGLLAGSAGVGLAFAAAVATVEPEWDRLFLLSTRDAR